MWACPSAVRQDLHDDASKVRSLTLTMTTCSTRRIVRLNADRLYLHALRRLTASRTPLDASRRSSVHFRGRGRTYMDTQLSRFKRSMTARPCRSSLVPFDGTISSERVAPSACSRRRHTRLLGKILRVVVITVGWHSSGAAHALAVRPLLSCSH